VRAELRRGGRVRWAAEASHTGPADLAETVTQLATEGGLERVRHAEAHLEPAIVQLRTLADLPPVRASALDALVQHQAVRFFRRGGSPLLTRAVWMPRRRRQGGRLARAVAVPAAWVSAVADGAQAAGLTLEHVVPLVDGCPVARLAFTPPAAADRRRQALRASVRRWGVFAALCWVVVVATAVVRLRAERARLDAELAALAKPVAAVSRARREIDRTRLMIATIASERQLQGATLRRLGALAEALPDSAYLTSLEFDGRGTGVLSGVGRQAAEIVAVLERRDELLAPRLEGPAVREIAGGREWERFTIRLGRDTTPRGRP
jgi:hypothetical protein